MTLYKNPYFWAATVGLLAVVGFSFAVLIPPVLAKLQENRSQITQLKTELEKQEKYLAAVQAVEQNETTLNQLHQTASLALPSQADSDILMLQFDGLLAQLGIGNASLNVPLSAPVAGSAEAAAAGNTVEVTISGPISYEALTALLDSLKTFSRWNRVSAFDIAKTGDLYSTNVATKAFFQPGRSSEFSGDSAIISKAQQVFAGLATYATNPDIATEGSYGKQNPFNP